jgi:hypothetical protein
MNEADQQRVGVALRALLGPVDTQAIDRARMLVLALVRREIASFFRRCPDVAAQTLVDLAQQAERSSAAHPIDRPLHWPALDPVAFRRCTSQAQRLDLARAAIQQTISTWG